MTEDESQNLYEKIKHKRVKYNEEIHCPMILRVMSGREEGTMSAFCVVAGISERLFYNWLKDNVLFQECYSLGKMFARENWEELGREIRDEVLMPGASNSKLDYWKMMGWSRFGIGKNSRIKLELNANDTPDKHYAQLLKQASEGDFTAGEIKQLMEAVNVGLNTHQVIGLQTQIDELTSKYNILKENNNVNNSSTNQRIEQKD
jgi:hypothetical protein